MLPESQTLVDIGVFFVGSAIWNFLTIHPMANAILRDGSSRKRSLSLSLEFALLSSTFLFAGAVLHSIVGSGLQLDYNVLLFSILLGDSLLVGLIKWWYLKRVYDTLYLYSFIITEWLPLSVILILLMIANIFPGLL